MKIPVNEPKISPNALKYVVDCIETGWISSAGSYIQKFEEKFAQYIGVKHAITTTSGTTALHLSLACLGISEGDEVIIPTHTMIACAFAILYTGATPVLIDVERDTWNMDIGKVEEKISPRTKAIMPVHIYGHPVDMDFLLELTQKYNIAIIEDAAEAHGAEYKGRRVGSLGNINCFSLYANKIITTGEGGMITTNSDNLAEKARSLKDLSHSPNRRFLHKLVGFNYRMTNLQAALGLAQLEKIEEYLEKKFWMASLYQKLLRDVPGLSLPVQKPWAKNVYWMYGVLVEDDFGVNRDMLQKKLKERGIDTRTFFIPIHHQPALTDLGLFKEGKCPVAEEISRRGLYLPSGLNITEEQIRYTCRVIKQIHDET